MQGSLLHHLCHSSHLPASKHHLNCTYILRFRTIGLLQRRRLPNEEVTSATDPGTLFWEAVWEISKLPCYRLVLTTTSHHPETIHWMKWRCSSVPWLFSKLVRNCYYLSFFYVNSKGLNSLHKINLHDHLHNHTPITAEKQQEKHPTPLLAHSRSILIFLKFPFEKD